jgi:hypothetical protein
MKTKTVYTFLSYLAQLILRMKNVSDKSCTVNPNTLLCSISFLENLAVYEIMRKNMVEPERLQVTNGACAFFAG